MGDSWNKWIHLLIWLNYPASGHIHIGFFIIEVYRHLITIQYLLACVWMYIRTLVYSLAQFCPREIVGVVPKISRLHTDKHFWLFCFQTQAWVYSIPETNLLVPMSQKSWNFLMFHPISIINIKHWSTPWW